MKDEPASSGGDKANSMSEGHIVLDRVVFALGSSLKSSNFSHLKGSRDEPRIASCIASASC